MCVVHQLDDWMAAYEESEAAARVAREATMTEEGWTVVVRSKVGVCAVCRAGWKQQLLGPLVCTTGVPTSSTPWMACSSR